MGTTNAANPADLPTPRAWTDLYWRDVVLMLALYLLLVGVDLATRTQVRCVHAERWSCVEEPEPASLRDLLGPRREFSAGELELPAIEYVYRPGHRGWALVLDHEPRRFNLPLRSTVEDAKADAARLEQWLREGSGELVLASSLSTTMRFMRGLYGLLVVGATGLAVRRWWRGRA